ncbi:hypothetical protein JCM21714_4392 [Gracilibacillus boraciitolerans JCM 21714]|uniref:Flagellar protein FliT n=1 Tax=Gracilibacillus boraciitolerans JCM 21714 TaxID=1298598 RepID=W4VQL2_9BACI|nr:flagellar protein FliT [Gracilibacillus boraciitolerans]GAE95178.1 hypothetical protein JCM21714_4392 [Gracilibacillus boraciitolerans JCM 21714]
MKPIAEYIQLTENMLELFEKALTNEQREKVIDQINKTIEERETLIKEIKPPFSDEEKEFGKRAISMDQQLNRKLQTVYQLLKKDMRNAKKQPRSNNSYLNPYKSVASYDGRFLDSKK